MVRQKCSGIRRSYLGVSMIPFIVRDDGSYVLGSPKQGLKNFIENK